MYQVPALNPSNNANLDLDVGLLMILFGFLLPMFAPWIPVINRIPRWIPLYKIIYRKYYASMAGGPPPAEVSSEPAPPPPRRETDRRRLDNIDNSLAGLNGPSVRRARSPGGAAGTYTRAPRARRGTSVTPQARLDPAPPGKSRAPPRSGGSGSGAAGHGLLAQADLTGR